MNTAESNCPRWAELEKGLDFEIDLKDRYARELHECEDRIAALEAENGRLTSAGAVYQKKWMDAETTIAQQADLLTELQDTVNLMREERVSMSARNAQQVEQLAAAEADAGRYRWLRDATGETPIRPAAFNSEIMPDIRLKFDFPTLVSYNCIGVQYTLDEAIDAAIAAQKGEK